MDLNLAILIIRSEYSVLFICKEQVWPTDISAGLGGPFIKLVPTYAEHHKYGEDLRLYNIEGFTYRE